MFFCIYCAPASIKKARRFEQIAAVRKINTVRKINILDFAVDSCYDNIVK